MQKTNHFQMFSVRNKHAIVVSNCYNKSAIKLSRTEWIKVEEQSWMIKAADKVK